MPFQFDDGLATLDLTADKLRGPFFQLYFDPTDEQKYSAGLEVVEQVVLDTELLWGQLDFLQEQLTSQFEVQGFVAGSAKVTTVMLASGFVIWAIKGGYLLTFMISAMPAWRLIDPLPVLSSWQDRDEDSEKKPKKTDVWDEFIDSDNP
ncbi:MAG: hypothetical protein GTO53_03390 [Planctomycetales bacterium]|nr:hypothetical protein [Planctomycetales bacterium]NIM08209.1 hypothetical protein [Planctomycetales bacterium]NIN07703.1 hypothetical protein [Planctomycetales bacterium]NIN76829.1 hypothetical protein [Planctomycetales bacterium]NIO34025.1 hypothetical protein [Planctomycetales bacterium]